MKIYLDLIIIINFLFDFILLSSVNYILKRNAHLFRLFLGSLSGSITLLILFIKIPNTILLLIKFLTSVIMLLLSFGFTNLNYLFKNILYFYLVSMLLGGGIYFLNNQFAYTNNGLIYTYHHLSISYFIILTIIGIFIFIKYLRSLNLLKTNYNNYYPCKIYFNETDYIEVTAYLDTGNKLIDPYTHKSIILINQNLHDFTQYPPIYVPFNTLNHHNLLKCYKVLKLEIEGRCCHNFLVGISTENFFLDGINCIINNRIMEDLK